MKTPLQLVTISLLAQVTFGKIRTRILEVQKTGTRYGSGYPDQLAKPEGFADVLREATTTAESVGHTDLALVPADDNRNDISQNNRQLFPFVMIAVITGIVVVGAVAITAIVRVTSPDNPPGIQTLTLDVDSDGSTRLTLTTDTTYLNADQTGLCDGCSIEVEAGACIEGDCVNYDQDATNDNISARIEGDPHMFGLLGQRIDWSGVDGGWYSLIKDENADLHINVRLTAPLADDFTDRQLITGLTVMSEGHSLAIEVENPYAIDTDGCPEGVFPCIADGGLRIDVDGEQIDELLRFSSQVPVADGAISLSASNLPVECRQFGGDQIWARMYQKMLEGRRELLGGESFEDWILSSDRMAAPSWCTKYIAENMLADVQSTHAIFKIETRTVTVRLNVGINYQGGGELNWDGRVLPDLDFWQMDLGMDGLDVENPALSGILGETARPVYDENGKEIMEGFEAFPGTVEDYRVSSSLGVHFPLLDKTEGGHK